MFKEICSSLQNGSQEDFFNHWCVLFLFTAFRHGIQTMSIAFHEALPTYRVVKVQISQSHAYIGSCVVLWNVRTCGTLFYVAYVYASSCSLNDAGLSLANLPSSLPLAGGVFPGDIIPGKGIVRFLRWQLAYDYMDACVSSAFRQMSIAFHEEASHTRYRALGPELIQVYRQSALRWP